MPTCDMAPSLLIGKDKEEAPVVSNEADIKRLLDEIESLAREEGATRVTQVSVWLGALTPMSAEHVRSHFVQQCKATVAEGACLLVDVSRDRQDPHAQELLLRGIEVEI